ncbi:unnamed protein product [Trifolium pratense]|uniref:Uncharacterized protein n=1 Tax=Trifolium pratense TaxID=57577 RepID=A0ACB0L503_TRIPR|nr:unnamed protein product [Trifolium pratense]
MEEAEDKLSNLPKFILHNILSRLISEEAARTSVLSKTWLDTWYTFPCLCFCHYNNCCLWQQCFMQHVKIVT